MYELRIDDGICTVDSLDKAIDIINDELMDHFEKYDQCYYNRMPFSVGVLEDCLYDSNSITDDEIILFGRISMLLNRIIEKDERIPALEYIKHDYRYHFEDGNIYDLNIIKKEDEIILSLVVDQGDYKDILETNMFSLNENKSYYFKSIQNVIIYSPGDKLPLGAKVSIDIALTKKED